MVRSSKYIVKQMFVKVQQVAYANGKGIKTTSKECQIHPQIYEKSMLDLCSKEWCNIYVEWVENARQTGAKIN